MEPQYENTVAVILTNDVKQTVEFYCDQMGFVADENNKHWTGFAGVWGGNMFVGIRLNPDLAANIKGQPIYFFVNNIEAMREKHIAAKVKFLSDLTTQPWGIKEYIVEDPNGYQLIIAESVHK